MKIVLKIWYVFITLLCFSCAEHEPYLKEFEDNPIKFNSYISKSQFSRGTPIESSNTLANMSVYAYYTGNGTSENKWADNGSTAVPNFMMAQTVNNSGYETGTNNWVYTPVIYWPSYTDANITFWSYSPVSTSSNGITVLNTTGGLSLRYITPTTCSDQPDLMMCVPIKDMNGSSDEAITFAMQHMLTCIGFSAMGTMDEIVSIALKNVVVSGNLSLNSSADTLQWTLDDAVSQVYYAGVNDTLLSANYVPVISSNGYLMLPPQTLSSDAEITVTTKNDSIKTYDISNQIWKAGQQIIYKINLSVEPATISVNTIQTSYVGAYWRYNETGERIIRMNNTGTWDAALIATDSNWDASDILIDYLPSSYNTEIGTLISTDILQMTETANIVSGTGDISFRIGLKASATLESSTSTPRFAIVMVKYDGLTKSHFIFLRQGEAPVAINGTTAFSPYNISSVQSSTIGTYEFTDYPSKAGGYKQWSTDAVVYPISGSSMTSSVNTDTIANVCPTGYRIPTQDDFIQLKGDSTALGGFYADGYFDRIAFSISTYGSQSMPYVIAGSDDDTAYAGALIYNINTYASVFLPDCGRRAYDTQYDITYNGLNGWYWSTTLPEDNTTSYPYYFDITNNNIITSSMKVGLTIASSYNRLDACSIRPVATTTTDADTSIIGTLNGFGDEDVWD